MNDYDLKIRTKNFSLLILKFWMNYPIRLLQKLFLFKLRNQAHQSEPIIGQLVEQEVIKSLFQN